MLLIIYGVPITLLDLTITIVTGYKNLVDRHETRQAAWQMPGWDECVLRTGKHDAIGWHLKLLFVIVPLIRHMETKILSPTKYSPLQ